MSVTGVYYNTLHTPDANRRFEHTQQLKRKRTETVAPRNDDTYHEPVAASSTSDDTEQDDRECTKGEHTYSSAIHSQGIVGPCSNAACRATVKALTDECAQLRAEINRLKDKTEELSE